MKRYKATLAADCDIGTLRRRMAEQGAQNLYLASKESAIFFEADEAYTAIAVEGTDGVVHVVFATE